MPGGCVVASFSLALTGPTSPTDSSKTETFKVDPSTKGVKVGLVGSCTTASQGMSLTWSDMDKENRTLLRMVSMTFTKNETGGNYGVSSISGMAEVMIK